MKLISFYLFFVITSTLFLFAQSEYYTDTTANIIYQRTIFDTTKKQILIDNKAKQDSLKLNNWDFYDKSLLKVYGNAAYILKNGELESQYFKSKGYDVPTQSINGGGLDIELLWGLKFIDTTNKNKFCSFDASKISLNIFFTNYGQRTDFSSPNYISFYFNIDYSKGYGWVLTDKSNLSLYKSLGVGESFLHTPISRDFLTLQSDFFATGIRYQYDKKHAVDFSISENLAFNGVVVPKLTLSKLVDFGGSALMDRYLTSYLIKSNNSWTPLYQIIYQSAWSYLLYSIKKSENYFPLSNTNNNFFVDTRYIFSLKFALDNSTKDPYDKTTTKTVETQNGY